MDFLKKRDQPGLTGILTIPNQKLRPDSIIQGILQLENKVEKVHHGIRVQLEAILSAGSSQNNKLQDSCCERTDVVNLMPGAEDVRLGKSYISYSPIGCQILGQPFNQPDPQPPDEQMLQETFSLPIGTTSYLFSFVMTTENLPASFNKLLGESLEYRAVAYMRETANFTRIALRIIPFEGYHPLAEPHPSTFPVPWTTPLALSIEWTIHSPRCNVKGILAKIDLTAYEPNYLPEDTMNIRISYKHRCYVSVRPIITITLVKRLKFNLNGMLKETDKVISEFQFVKRQQDCDGESIFGELRVPWLCPPSFESPSYSLTYVIKYALKVAKYSAVLRGEEKITIGTIRTEKIVEDNHTMRTIYSSSEDAVARNAREDDEFFQQFGDGDDLGELHLLSRRFGSDETLCSEMSFAASCISLPPAYSQLSSRAESLLSLETLPPNYEDIF